MNSSRSSRHRGEKRLRVPCVLCGYFPTGYGNTFEFASHIIVAVVVFDTSATSW